MYICRDPRRAGRMLRGLLGGLTCQIHIHIHMHIRMHQTYTYAPTRRLDVPDVRADVHAGVHADMHIAYARDP